MQPESRMVVNDHQQTRTPAGTSGTSATAWCADWRDASAYPRADASLADFAWEFLRRNALYVADFDSLVALVARGGTDAELAQLHDDLARRWSVIAMVDPSRAAPPRWRRDASALDDRFISIRFDASTPLRPQLAGAKAVVTDFALAWIKRNPEDAPRSLRIGGQRNGGIYQECLRVIDALSLNIPRREIQNTLWTHLNEDDQRERLRHRIRRGLELVEGYRALVADTTLQRDEPDAASDWREISEHVISPYTASVDRVR